MPNPRALAVAALTAATTGALVAALAEHPAIAASLSAGIAGSLALRAAAAARRADALRARAEDATRLASIGLATAGFLHELRNAVMVLAGFAELAVKATPAETRARGHAEEVERQARRLRERLQTFLRIGRGGTGGEVGSFEALAREVYELLRPVAIDRGLAIDAVLVEGLDRPCDAARFRSIALDLGLNGIAHARSRVLVRTRRAGDEVVFAIEDDGAGVDAALGRTIFEPFVSGRDGGTGIGLASAAALAAEEGGSLTCEASALGGAAFMLRLPVRGARESADTAADAPTSGGPANG